MLILELVGPFEIFLRLCIFVLFLKDSPQVIVRQCISGVELDRPLVVLLGLIEVFLGLVGASQIVVGVRGLRIKLNNSAVALDG